MNEDRYYSIIGLTFIIQFFLIYIFLITKTNIFEKIFIIFSIISQIIFLLCLFNRNYEKLFQYMHICYILSVIFLTIFVTNKILILLLIFVIIINISYWIVDGDCPLGNDVPHEFEYIKNKIENYTTDIALFLLLILMIKYLVIKL